MKIAFMFYDRAEYRGGPTVNALRVLPEFHRRGHEVHALIECQGGFSPGARALAELGIGVHQIAIEQYVEDRITGILEILRDLRPDVFVPNSSVAGWYAARWVRIAGIPTVAALRNDDSFHWAMVGQFVSGNRNWAVSGLVCVSENLLRKAESLRPRNTQLARIPSGVPVPETTVCQAGQSELRLLYVGRLVQEQKRIRELTDAFIKTVQHVPGVRATICGQGYGNERERIEAKIRDHGLGDVIKVRGAVEPGLIHNVMRHHHAIVLLSDHEGTPGSIMDGMASGLVPVCLNIEGGVRELVIHDQTGLLVSNRDEEFLYAVRRLKDDVELRCTLARNARKHIEDNYSLAGAATRWLDFFSSLLSSAKTKTSLIVPRRLGLPPVHSAFAREDIRLPVVKRFKRRLRLEGSKTRSQTDHEALRRSAGRDQFLEPACTVDNMDRFLVRSSVLAALRSRLDLLHGTVLDVGCGQQPYKPLLLSEGTRITEYIGLDLASNPIHDNMPDICWKDGKIPLQEGSVDCAICTEVFEHCPEPEDVMKEVYRVIRPGGVLFFSVPFLWPLHEVPYDEYRFTPFALERHLRRSGFNDVEIAAMGGWDASLAQMLGLWVRRRHMGKWKRGVLSCLLYPLYRLLLYRDKSGFTTFSEHSMVSGLTGVARKAVF